MLLLVFPLFLAVAVAGEPIVTRRRPVRTHFDGVAAVGAPPLGNLSSVITGAGYTLEIHNAETPDGWTLPLYRIGTPDGKTDGKAVFLQHGLESGADCWVLNGPRTGESLGFVLRDAGYDVWLGNTRACNWAPHNARFTPRDAGYWNFTFDDMIAQDLPVSLAKVVSLTRQPRVHLVGHSQGTLMAFGALSVPGSPVRSMVRSFVALAPVAHVGHVRSDLLRALADLHAGEILALFGERSFGIEPSIVERLLPALCGRDPLLCKDVISLTTGKNCCVNDTRIPFYLTLEPSPTSVRNMIHYTQQIRSGDFRRFDYGREGNVRAYGSETPPPYDLGQVPVSIPIQLHAGGGDYLADLQDVEIIAAELPADPEMHVYPAFAHLDFVVGTSVGERMVPRVLRFLGEN